MRTIGLIVVAAIGVGAITAPLAAHAAGCANSSLKGMYGFESTVTQNNEVPPHFLEIVGLFRFDGSGNGKTSFTVAQSDGAGGPDSVAFAYSVAPDCTFTYVQENGETFSGVIVRDSQAFYFIETSGACCGSAIIRRGHAERIRTGG
jgi:hypothetical protein